MQTSPATIGRESRVHLGSNLRHVSGQTGAGASLPLRPSESLPAGVVHGRAGFGLPKVTR